jgi:hypothetical protein
VVPPGGPQGSPSGVPIILVRPNELRLTAGGRHVNTLEFLHELARALCWGLGAIDRRPSGAPEEHGPTFVAVAHYLYSRHLPGYPTAQALAEAEDLFPCFQEIDP